MISITRDSTNTALTTATECVYLAGRLLPVINKYHSLVKDTICMFLNVSGTQCFSENIHWLNRWEAHPEI